MARLRHGDPASTSQQESGEQNGQATTLEIEVLDHHGRSQGLFLVNDLLRRLAGRREVFSGTYGRQRAVLKRYAGHGAHGACIREADKLQYLVKHGLPGQRADDETGGPIRAICRPKMWDASTAGEGRLQLG